jgi:hypothetical protein
VLLELGAPVVALACVVASARRLARAVAPIDLEPRAVLKALEGDRADEVLRSLRAVLASGDRFAWERDLLAAFDEADERVRDALIGEQLLELEGRMARSARVPRVCASIATSAGLLFGSLALLKGLAVPQGEDASAATHAALSSALGAVALGIAATAFCVAVHVRAARVSRERRVAIDELVTRLQRLCVARRPT